MIELIGQLARVGLAEPAESHRFSKILVVNGGLAHRAVIDSAISGSLRSRFSGRRAVIDSAISGSLRSRFQRSPSNFRVRWSRGTLDSAPSVAEGASHPSRPPLVAAALVIEFRTEGCLWRLPFGRQVDRIDRLRRPRSPSREAQFFKTASSQPAVSTTIL